MKKIFVLVISVFLSACLYSQGNEPFATYSFSSFLASSIKSVEASTVNGGITVNGSDASEAVVEMLVSRNNNSGGGIFSRRNRQNDDVKQILEDEFTIDVKVEGGKLYAIARPKNQRGNPRLNISFKISVPNQVDSNISSVNGSIQLGDLSGSHNIGTVNGALRVDNVSGSISGSTVNGSINAANMNGRVRLSTVNGGISISDARGAISTSTVNGRVTERNVIRE